MYRKGDTSDLARFYTGHHPIQFLAKLDENQKKKNIKWPYYIFFFTTQNL